MKIVSKSIGHLSNIERYDLHDVFSPSATSCGLTICYAISICKNSTLTSLDLKAKHEEIGVVEKWHKKYSHESFAALFHGVKEFLDIYDKDDFGRWTLSIVYQNIEVIISGERDKTEIGVSYPNERNLNLLPLLSEIESSTYEFNNYDMRVLSMLKTDFGMSEKRAVLAVQKLLAHKDIYDEFVLVAMTGKYAKESSAVSVEGYTAEMLNSNYPLSVLGSYNYLIYLRESPKEALEDLKKGLPRK